MHALHPFFHPRSIAIIGASSDPERIGGRPLRFLIEAGFAGAIYPVNTSGHAELQGRRAWRSVLDIGEPIDHAIVAVPLPAVEQAVADCARQGVKAVQVFTAGFAEAGPEGAALQRRLVEIARGAGMRLIGPNALGLIHPASGLFATFSTLLNGLKPGAGCIGLATQSGAFGSASYGAAALRGLGLSVAVATGNEADVDVAECIAYLAQDPDTRVICTALEACRDGTALRAALLAAADAGKPVVVMKIGRSALGAAAAATHTGGLAGNDAVFDAVIEECGAVRASSIDEMLDIAQFFSTGQAAATLPNFLPTGPRIGVVTGSGGIGVLIADEAEPLGLSLPPLPEAAQRSLREVLPFVTPANPYDTTAQVTSVPQGIERTVEAMLAHGGCDTVIAYLAHAGLSPQRFAGTETALADLARQYPQQRLMVVMLATPEVQQRLAEAGVVVFADASRAVRALGAAWALRQRRAALHRVAPPQAAREPLPEVATEASAKACLAAAGLPVPAEHACATREAAVRAADTLGYPVVAKILSAHIPHKTEVGGVMLNLADAAAVASAFDELLRRAARHRPDARIDGVLIAPMLSGGVETIAGVIVDPAFGPMLMFGLGGIATELFRDVAFASAPLTQARAQALISATRAGQLLAGWRGAPPADRDALADALVKLSEFAAAHAHELAAVDINPLVVRERGCACLDAVIERRPAQ
ncbi:MAG: acetate--CoA ligase family protein [Burkholderiaceae bacterium]|nr:acetate--CoA ligase family protein [Burkholderiaceae bacterium]